MVPGVQEDLQDKTWDTRHTDCQQAAVGLDVAVVYVAVGLDVAVVYVAADYVVVVYVAVDYVVVVYAVAAHVVVVHVGYVLAAGKVVVQVAAENGVAPNQ